LSPEILGIVLSTLAVADWDTPESIPSFGVAVQVMLEGWENGPERMEAVLLCGIPSMDQA